MYSRTLLIRQLRGRGHDQDSKKVGLSEEHIYLHENFVKQQTKLNIGELCFAKYKITLNHN